MYGVHMTLDETKTELARQENLIEQAKAEICRLKSAFLQENAKFKVGDHVKCEGWYHETSHYSDEMTGIVLRVHFDNEGPFYIIRPDDGQTYWQLYPTVTRSEVDLTLIESVKS